MAPEDLGAFQAGCEAECLVVHVAAELARQSIQPNPAGSGMVARTSQVVGARIGRRTRAGDSGGAGSHRG